MENVEVIAREIANAAVLVILAVIALVYGIRRILELLGFRPKSPESGAVESLSRSLEASLQALRSTTQRIDGIARNISALVSSLQTWQQPVVERLERIERLIRGEGERKR